MSDNIKIKIEETNLTTSRPFMESSDIVYVPGLSGSATSSGMYRSAKHFMKNVTAYKYTDDDVTTLTELGFTDAKKGDVDVSYNYALGILKAGLQVYYDYCITDEDNTGKSVKAFYNTLANDRLDAILDKNEYTIKYITTGGYPAFALRQVS